MNQPDAEGLHRLGRRAGFDFETWRFAPERLCPPIVCASVAMRNALGELGAGIYASGDPQQGGRPAPLAVLYEMLMDEGLEIVLQNGCFDLATAMVWDESLIKPIFDAIEAGRIRDTMIREKMLNIAEFGEIEFKTLDSGVTIRVKGLDLAHLEVQYGISEEERIRDKDDDADDALRVSFEGLDGIASEHYPADMRTYSIQDAVGVLCVSEAQDTRAAGLIREGRVPGDPFATEPLRVGVALTLYLASAYGMRIDVERHVLVEADLKRRVAPEALPLLFASGIIRPGRVGAIGKSGRPVKDLPPTRDLAALRGLIERLSAESGTELVRTEKGGISTSAETVEGLMHLSPVLEQYHERESHMKMLTTDLPRMRAPVVHPRFDVVKKTGRTSSSAAKLYPSMNAQNPHSEARQLVIPRHGWLLFSVDFSTIELVTLAQTVFRILGWSTLRDVINQGIDPHAYLGSSLCYSLKHEFRDACQTAGITTAEGVFEAFRSLKAANCPVHPKEKHTDHPECTTCGAAAERRAVFAHYRKFAKPTGLGFPGGLGPDTFCGYAKGTFGVSVDRDTAVALRQVWHQTYPEMRPYFAHITNSMKDPWHPGRHAYSSPSGFYRAGCTFTECANGFGLQTPAAEGGTLAFYRVSREAYDESLGSVLYDGVRPLSFIHDEIFGEVRNDGLAHERILRVQELMVESMRTICPDVAVKTAACLMERWSKAAEPVFGPDGRLQVWRP